MSNPFVAFSEANSCSQCAAGKSSIKNDDISSELACQNCQAGQFSIAGASSCKYDVSYCENALGVTCDANSLKEMWPFLAPLESKVTSLESSVGGIAVLESTSTTEAAKVSTLETKTAALELTSVTEVGKVTTLETKTTTLETTVASEKLKVSTLETTATSEGAKVVTLETKTAALESTSTTEAGKVV